jgi:hypothetical protein|tara:strand:+ start:1985 stop:2179 length:195 start_codon:yes stop_codon:yes gene_type:complete
MKSRNIRFASGDARQKWISDCKSRENRESGKANRNALIFMGGLTVLVLMGIVIQKKWGVFSPQN